MLELALLLPIGRELVVVLCCWWTYARTHTHTFQQLRCGLQQACVLTCWAFHDMAVEVDHTGRG